MSECATIIRQCFDIGYSKNPELFYENSPIDEFTQFYILNRINSVKQLLHEILNSGKVQFHLIERLVLLQDINFTPEMCIKLFPHIAKHDKQLECLAIFRDHIPKIKYTLVGDCINFESESRNVLLEVGNFKSKKIEVDSIKKSDIIQIFGLRLLMVMAFLCSIQNSFTEFEDLNIPVYDQLTQIVLNVNTTISDRRWTGLSPIAILTSSVVKFCDHRTLTRGHVVPSKSTCCLYYRKYLRRISKFLINPPFESVQIDCICPKCAKI